MSECGKGWVNRCAHSKGKRCRCRCGGANHGKAVEREERGDLFNPEGEPFVLEIPYPRAPQVGAICELLIPCLGNPIGALGICYEVYELAGRPGYSFVFENGHYDGFAYLDIPLYLRPVGFSPSVSGYQFRNVTQLARDFERGIFAPVFEVARKEAAA